MIIFVKTIFGAMLGAFILCWLVAACTVASVFLHLFLEAHKTTQASIFCLSAIVGVIWALCKNFEDDGSHA